MVSSQILNFPMDSFYVLSEISCLVLILLVVCVNMLAFVFRVVRFEE